MTARLCLFAPPILFVFAACGSSPGPGGLDDAGQGLDGPGATLDGPAMQSLPAHYHLTLVAQPATALSFEPAAINRAGAIVGTLRKASDYGYYAFRVDGGALVDISGGMRSHAFAIADDGTVVGTVDGSNGLPTAAMAWPPGATAPSIEIPSFDAQRPATPRAIAGTIVVGTDYIHGLAWDLAHLGAPTVLKTLDPTSYTTAGLAVNAAGVIGGYSDDYSHATQAAVWPTATSAPMMLASAGAYTGNQVNGVNASGEMVGLSGLNDVIWKGPGAAPVSLGFGDLRAINDGGVAVGEAMTGGGLVWTQASGPVQITTLLDAASAALVSSVDYLFAINASGVIVGIAKAKDGATEPIIVATPVE